MSVWASDDLASVIIRPDLEFAGWGQGVIEAWNPSTFENVIQYRGSRHENLAVASGVEALTYQPGDVVMLSRWQPTGGGATTLRIGAGGRVIVPGAGAAEKAVAALKSNLGRAVALAVFGEAIRVGTGFGTTDIFDDASDPTPIVDLISGTQVSVTATVGETGRALIIMSAGMIGARPNTGQTGFINMYYHISGAHSKTSNAPAMSIGRGAAHSDELVGERPMASMSRVFVEQNLNPGESTFSLFGYWSNPGNGNGFVSHPEIIVIPF